MKNTLAPPSPESLSLGLTCSSLSIDIIENVTCTVTIIYSCYSPLLTIDFGDSSPAQEEMLSPSPTLTTLTRTAVKVFNTTGSFPLIATIRCTNLTNSSQEIISVTDGKIQTIMIKHF